MRTPPNDSPRTTAATGPGSRGALKASTTGPTGTGDEATGTLRILAAILVVAAYVAWFYLADSRRRILLGFLLVPEELVHSWVEGDWSRFGVLDHLPVVAGAGLICGIATASGWLVLSSRRWFGWLTGGERWVASGLVGLNLWSLLACGLGLCGQLRHRGLFASIAAAVIVSAVIVAAIARAKFRAGKNQRGAVSTPPETALTWFGKIPLALCVPFAWFILWGGTLPATHFDVREYHLQVPKEWFQQGRVTFLPHNVYGNMPQGAEMHAVLGMLLGSGTDDWWWGALIGKTVMASFALWGAAGVYFVTRRFAGPDAGAWGAFAYLATPWIAHVSMTGLIDGVVAAYVAGAMLVALPLLLATPTDPSPPRAVPNRAVPNRADLVQLPVASCDWKPRESLSRAGLAGFLAGGAVACKYPALLFLVIPLGALIVWLPRRRVDWRVATSYSLAVVLACGLWFGKNLALAGNPTYPLLYSVFGGESWNAEKDARWTKAHGPPHDAQGRQFTLAQAGDSLRILLIASDHHGPWLLPLAFLSLAWWRTYEVRSLLRVLCGLVAFGVASWWLLTHRIDRFLVPLVPLLAVAAGLGATWNRGFRWRRATAALGIFCGLATFAHVASPYGADNRVLIALRDLRHDLPRDAEHSLGRMNPGHHWLNQNVKPGERVLLVGEAQVFDLEMPILYNTCFDDCVFETLLRDRTVDERRRVLRERRIAYLFVSWYELQRYRQPGNYGYSEYPTRELFHDELVGRQRILRPVTEPTVDSAFEIFQVVDEPSSGATRP